MNEIETYIMISVKKKFNKIVNFRSMVVINCLVCNCDAHGILSSRYSKGHKIILTEGLYLEIPTKAF